MKHYYHTIQGWFTFPNFYKNAVEQAKEGYHFVEIGSWKGASSVYMGVEIINSQKKIFFDCIDTWEGTPDETVTKKDSPDYELLLETKNGLYNHFLNNIAPLSGIINPIQKTSIEASNLYTEKSLNLVFIDAAHDYKSVYRDVEYWLPKVKKGGILAGHDIFHEPVQQAVTDILGNNFQTTNENVWFYKIKE